MSRFKTWFESDKHTDVNFSFKTSSSSKGKMSLRNDLISAHKLVLGVRSPVLEELLLAPERKDRREFLLTDEPMDFKQFLKFLYGDPPTSDTLLSIFKCAIKYQVELKQAEFQNHISSKNTLELYEINHVAPEHKNKGLFRAMLIRKLEESPHILSNKANLTTLSLNTLIDIIQDDSEIPQAARYSGLTLWAELECNKNKTLATYENKRKILGPHNVPEILINFQDMTTADFAEVVSTDNLMGSTFIIETFRQFAITKTFPLRRNSKQSSFKEKRFRIRCTVDQGKVITLATSPNNHIEDVKEALANHPDGLPFHEQKIVFSGQQLENGRSLASYNIQDKDMIHVLRRNSFS